MHRNATIASKNYHNMNNRSYILKFYRNDKKRNYWHIQLLIQLLTFWKACSWCIWMNDRKKFSNTIIYHLSHRIIYDGVRNIWLYSFLERRNNIKISLDISSDEKKISTSCFLCSYLLQSFAVLSVITYLHLRTYVTGVLEKFSLTTKFLIFFFLMIMTLTTTVYYSLLFKNKHTNKNRFRYYYPAILWKYSVLSAVILNSLSLERLYVTNTTMYCVFIPSKY